MTRPYLRLEHPIRLAHRGSRVLWPENTIAAFQGAVDLGYRYLEVDVRRTGDGEVVVIHDATLDRTTNGVGRVADWTWQDLRHLDAGYAHGAGEGFPFRDRDVGIPRLADAFATFPDVHFNIDLKAPGIEWAVADVIRGHGREDSVMIGSFFDRRLARFRRISRGQVATSAGPAATVAMWTASRARRTAPRPADAYQLPIRRGGASVDQRLVAACHEVGAHVHVWTVNEPDEMHRLLDLGVDGIVTDRPDVLNDVIAARGARA